MDGDIALGLVTLIYGPLILYPIIGIPFMLCLVIWFAAQDMTTAICRMFGWKRPNWAVSHTEEVEFYPYEGE